MFFIKTVGVL